LKDNVEFKLKITTPLYTTIKILENNKLCKSEKRTAVKKVLEGIAKYLVAEQHIFSTATTDALPDLHIPATETITTSWNELKLALDGISFTEWLKDGIWNHGMKIYSTALTTGLAMVAAWCMHRITKAVEQAPLALDARADDIVALAREIKDLVNGRAAEATGLADKALGVVNERSKDVVALAREIKDIINTKSDNLAGLAGNALAALDGRSKDIVSLVENCKTELFGVIPYNKILKDWVNTLRSCNASQTKSDWIKWLEIFKKILTQINKAHPLTVDKILQQTEIALTGLKRPNSQDLFVTSRTDFSLIPKSTPDNLTTQDTTNVKAIAEFLQARISHLEAISSSSIAPQFTSLLGESKKLIVHLQSFKPNSWVGNFPAQTANNNELAQGNDENQVGGFSPPAY
jgi:hypothetical protein